MKSANTFTLNCAMYLYTDYTIYTVYNYVESMCGIREGKNTEAKQKKQVIVRTKIVF